MKAQSRAYLTFALGLSMALAGCQNHDAAPKTEGKTVAAEVATVRLLPLPQIDAAPGTVVAEQQVQVASRLMGYIREIRVHEGDAVKAGQLLLVIDPADIQGGVEQARAGAAQADAALADAQADYQRFTNLYKDESVSKQQYDKIKLQYRVAQSQAAAARAGLNTALSQRRYAEVRAPIDGVVTQKMASAGDLAAPGRPLLALENARKLQVQTAVSDETYARIKLGDRVAVAIDGRAEPVQATIAHIVPAADPMSHTHLVKLDLPAVAGLRSGAFARVRFAVGSRQGIRVPAAALLLRAGISGVFTVDAQGIAHYRMVRSGDAGGGEVEILAGLNPGDRVVVSGNADLDSGDRVNEQGSRKP